MREAAAARPDIVLSDGYVEGDRLTALTALCDCYVSLHRSEGFGLTIAEAMAFGKPAIATGYCGNLAFMDAESSYLVPYELATLDEAVGPYPAGTEWADPDLDEAARLMRHVVEQPDEARERGRRGKAAVEERQSLERAAEFLGDRIPQFDRLLEERQAHETPGSRAAEFLAFGPSLAWDAHSAASSAAGTGRCCGDCCGPTRCASASSRRSSSTASRTWSAHATALDRAVRQLEERLRSSALATDAEAQEADAERRAVLPADRVRGNRRRADREVDLAAAVARDERHGTGCRALGRRHARASPVAGRRSKRRRHGGGWSFGSPASSRPSSAPGRRSATKPAVGPDHWSG